MKKDILFLCQYFHPEYVSSATLPTQLAEDLAKMGLSVDVVCANPQEYYDGEKVKAKEVYKGIRISRVKYAKLNNKSRVGRLINFFSFFLPVFLRIPLLLQYKCILVYSNPPILPLVPYVISKLTKTKFIFVSFDVYPDNALIMGAINKGSLLEKIMNQINKLVYNSASKVVVLGNEMKQYIIENKSYSRETQIEVIPNWYNDELMSKDKLIHNELYRNYREKYSLIVLYSGNMGVCQDMDTILHCINRFRNNNEILFVFTGHGSKVEYIKKFIFDNKIDNAVVHGFLTGQDYVDVLNISDVCLVSLEKGIEGIGVPSKTYGYLAAGKPVITIMSQDTDITRQLIDYHAGGNVSQGDDNELHSIIARYMSNKPLVLEHGVNARMLFERHYTRTICTRKYYELIREVVYS